MPVVYWYRVKNPSTGEMEEGARKATEETIDQLGGEKVLGSAEEIEDAELEPGGFFDSPWPPKEALEHKA